MNNLTSPIATFVYYATPDVVRRPILRRLTRAVALSAMVAAEASRFKQEIETGQPADEPRVGAPSHAGGGDSEAVEPGELSAAMNFAGSTGAGSGAAGSGAAAGGSVAAGGFGEAGKSAGSDEPAEHGEPVSLFDLAKEAFEVSPKGTLAVGAGILGITAASIAATVKAERAIFRRGEKRRDNGDRFAHTKQALLLAGSMVALNAVMDRFDAELEA